MNRSQKLAIDDSEEFGMSKQRDVSNSDEIRIVYIDGLPLSYILILS